MKPACPRIFEAEALRDGRLSGSEAARFQAHSSTCATCARETQRLRELAEALRAPVAGTDDLHVRRERTRLLAAFDARLVLAPSRRSPRAWHGAVAAILAAAVLALALRHASPVKVAVTTSQPPPQPEVVSVRADSSAKWSRHAEADREMIALESGTLAIKVDHSTSSRQVLVTLPDGELEDVGTTFSVTARAGKTTQVTVQEGSVVLRLRGSTPVELGAGAAWTPAAVAPSSHGSVSAPAHSAPRAAGSAPHLASSVAAAPGLPPLPDPAAEFREAVGALSRGDNDEAGKRLRAFVVAHPADSRAEDAAYLQVLALQRAGNLVGAQQAAAAYLQRFPRGFRKAEVEALATKH